jgi:hypothetical protein
MCPHGDYWSHDPLLHVILLRLFYTCRRKVIMNRDTPGPPPEGVLHKYCRDDYSEGAYQGATSAVTCALGVQLDPQWVLKLAFHFALQCQNREACHLLIRTD